MLDLHWMLVMPGVFLAIAVVYYLVSAAGLVLGAIWRTTRRLTLPHVRLGRSPRVR